MIRRATSLLLLTLILVTCGEKPGKVDSPAAVPVKAEPPAPTPAERARSAAERGDLEELAALAAGEDAAAVRVAARSGLSAFVGWRISEAGPEAAVALLLKAPSPPARDPSTDEAAVLEDAWALLDRRLPDEAMERIDELPDDLGAAWLLRAFATEGREFGTAIARALAEGVDRDTAALAAGRLFARAGELEAAEGALRASADPRAAGPLAMVILARGRGVQAALEVLGEIKAPGNPGADRARLLLLVLANRLEEAEALLAAILPGAGDDPSIREGEGALRLREGDRDAAEAAFRKALLLDPDSATAHRNLAGILTARGRKDEALDHLEAALGGRAGSGVVGRARASGQVTILGKGRALAQGAYDLALRHLARGSPPETVTGFLRRSTRAEPTFASPWLALSELRLRSGDLEGAVEVLREGAKPIAVGEERAGLLLRLAIRLLMAGDTAGYEKIAGGIGKKTAAGRLLAGLGPPSPDGPAILPGWPRVRLALGKGRHAAQATALFGDAGTEVADQAAFLALLAKKGAVTAMPGRLSPEDAFAGGSPLLIRRLRATERGNRLEFLVLCGYAAGLGAFLVDDPDPTGPVVISASEVAAGLLYRLPVEGETPAPDPRATALARALSRLDAGQAGDAVELLPPDSTHPLAAYVAARSALSAGEAAQAAAILEDALERSDHDALRLLRAEALLLAGEVGKAIQCVNRMSNRTDSLLVRRLKALALLSPGRGDEAVEALEGIRRERPDYLPVYKDLSGIHISRGRYRAAYGILSALAERDPEVRSDPGFQRAMERTYEGLGTSASRPEDLEPLLACEDPEIRKLAVKGAGVLPVRDGSAILSRLAVDPEKSVRALALRYVGERRMKGALEAVRKGLEDDVAIVRGAAARAFARLTSREGAREIVPLLRDPEAYVRDVAARELRALAGKSLGYDPRAPEVEREEGAKRWEKWAKEW